VREGSPGGIEDGKRLGPRTELTSALVGVHAPRGCRISSLTRSLQHGETRAVGSCWYGRGRGDGSKTALFYRQFLCLITVIHDQKDCRSGHILAKLVN
jgi:hypothetical protein